VVAQITVTSSFVGVHRGGCDYVHAQGYSRNGSYLNQYVTAPAGPVSNDSDHQATGYAGLTYGYLDGKLVSVSGNGNSYSAQYDALGRCITRSLNGRITYYTYDGQRPIYEWNPDGTKAGWNLYGQGIDEILLRGDYVIVPKGQGYFFQQNRLGSVTHLTGFAGELIEKYRYDAFGATTTLEPVLGYFNNRFRFTGREYLEPFGIYEYRNRAYHPGLGRFLSEDPMGFDAGDMNLFRYCGNDPVNRSDARGTQDGFGFFIPQTGPGGLQFTDPNYDPRRIPTDPEMAFRYQHYVLETSGRDRGGISSNTIHYTVLGTVGTVVAVETSPGWLPFVVVAGLYAAQAYAEDPHFFDQLFELGHAFHEWYEHSAGNVSTDIYAANGAGSFYGFADGSYGIYDNEGNGVYIWDTNGSPGDVIGQTTDGTVITQSPGGGGGGGPHDTGITSSGAPFPEPYPGYSWWGGSTQSRIPVVNSR
jgi:RHS repeat-associated protein